MSLERLDCRATTLTSLSINLLVIFWITLLESLVLSKNTECLKILNKEKLQILSLKKLEAANLGVFLPDECLFRSEESFLIYRYRRETSSVEYLHEENYFLH